MTVCLGITNIIKRLEVKVVLFVKTLASVPVVAGSTKGGDVKGCLNAFGAFYACGYPNGSVECYNSNMGLKNAQSGFALNIPGCILFYLPVFFSGLLLLRAGLNIVFISS